VTETARPAEDSDGPACARLLDLILGAAQTMRGGPALVGHETAETLLARWQGPEGASLWVGEYAGVVVGLLAVTVHDARSRIECCYVEEGARGVGVGSALMHEAVAWSEARGCQEVDALALPGDRQTKQRLEAAGFTARLLTLSRRLG